MEMLKPSLTLKKENFLDKIVGGVGVLRSDLFKMGMNGSIAIKGDTGSYFTYDVASKTLVDVMDFALDMPDMFYRVPVQAVAVGDLILRGGEPMYVDAITNGVTRVLNVCNQQFEELAATTNVMGLKFYTKIVSVMTMFGGPGGATGGMNPMMMMLLMGDKGGIGGNDSLKNMLLMQAMSGTTGNAGGMNPMMMMMLMGDKGGFGGDDSMSKLMMMSMMGGGTNPLGAMFGTPAV